jgi:hypothetical protein
MRIKATVYGMGELTKVNALRQAVPIAKAIKMNHKIAVGSSPSCVFPPSPSVAASARRRRLFHICSRENSVQDISVTLKRLFPAPDRHHEEDDEEKTTTTKEY